MSTSLVSIVIITYNEEKNIRACLESVIASDYLSKEIIVVDGGSTDKTIDVIKQFPEVTLMQSAEKGMPYQRNYGFNKAKGKYILALDADMRIDKHLITHCVNLSEGSEQVVGIYIPEIILGNSLFHEVRRYERSFYNATVIDAIRFFRNDVAKGIGYFDTTLPEACEDWDFDKRLRKKGQTALSSSPLFHDESKLSLSAYIAKKQRYTTTVDAYLKKWGKDDPDVKKQFGLHYRYFEVFVENGKWKKILRNPLLFISMFIIKVIVGFAYILRTHKKVL